MNDETLLKKLRQAFITEAGERLDSLSDQLLKLEQVRDRQQQQPFIDVIYREAHSLKGAARAVNLVDIEALFQALESALSHIRESSGPFPDSFFDLAYQCIRALEKFLENFNPQDPAPENEFLKELTGKVAHFSPENETGPISIGKPEPAPPTPEKPPEPVTDTQPLLQAPIPKRSDSIRISTEKLDTLFYRAEEMISLKLESDQHLKNLKMLQKNLFRISLTHESIDKWMHDIRHFANRNGDLAECISRLETLLKTRKEHHQVVFNQLRSIINVAEQHRLNQARMVDNLLDETKNAMLQPCEVLFNQFPLMVREISRQQGKRVDFSMEGTSIEIDRRVLEKMKDPLVHLIRNAIDHGIEPPDERQEKGKPPEGRIRLMCRQNESQKIKMILEDDGRGINTEHLKQKALQKGILASSIAGNLSEKESVNLIFKEGISTAPLVTEVSGRGLGMSIVSEKVEMTGGTLDVDTTKDTGTVFTIELPVSLATFRGVIIRVAGAWFILPANQVQQVIRVHETRVRSVENRPAILFRNRTIALVDLGALLGLPRCPSPPGRDTIFHAAVIGSGDRAAAFKIDDVAGEEEILVKSLGKQLVRIPHIFGATILGSGQVVPILNPKDLLNASHEVQTVFDTRDIARDTPKKILLAEDSITSRILIKNILETAGYTVKTAIDGQEAYQILNREPVDLVVSDVEMPNMDGFELTRMIRQKPDFETLPVVLVTSLGSDRDRERGIEAGADAYIAKSEFDQHHLLDIIRMLI